MAKTQRACTEGNIRIKERVLPGPLPMLVQQLYTTNALG